MTGLVVNIISEIFTREYGESKNCVIFTLFLKNEGDSAICLQELML